MSEGRYSVRWAEVAVQDLERLVENLQTENPQAARKLLDHVAKKATSLKLMPLRGRRVPELAYFELSTYRELLIRPYRLIYRVEAQDVWVVAVFDGRRDLSDVLLWRLMEL